MKGRGGVLVVTGGRGSPITCLGLRLIYWGCWIAGLSYYLEEDKIDGGRVQCTRQAKWEVNHLDTEGILDAPALVGYFCHRCVPTVSWFSTIPYGRNNERLRQCEGIIKERS